MSKTFTIFLLFQLLFATALTGQHRHKRCQKEEEIKRIVKKALVAAPPAGYARIPSGVRLLSVKIEKEAIILNFSRELVSNSTTAELEDALHQILSKIGDRTPHVKGSTYKILIEGRPLQDFLDSKKED